MKITTIVSCGPHSQIMRFKDYKSSKTSFTCHKKGRATCSSPIGSLLHLFSNSSTNLNGMVFPSCRSPSHGSLTGTQSITPWPIIHMKGMETSQPFFMPLDLVTRHQVQVSRPQISHCLFLLLQELVHGQSCSPGQNLLEILSYEPLWLLKFIYKWPRIRTDVLERYHFRDQLHEAKISLESYICGCHRRRDIIQSS